MEKIMLPKIKHPQFSLTLPISKKDVVYRPMLAREEKILLMAKENSDKFETLSAVRQVANDCITTENFNIDDLSIIDLEFLFIKIRSASIGNIINVSYQDGEDKEIRNFDVNLENVGVNFPSEQSNTIIVNDEIVIDLKYPPSSLYIDKTFLEATGADVLTKLILSCISKISQKGIKLDGYNDEELLQWLDQLPIKTFEQFKTFFGNLPTLYYKITYTNKLGNERTIELTTLQDFFTLG